MPEISQQESQENVDINHEFKLTESNYISKIHKKKQIIIGNTGLLGMHHFDLWGKKINGNFKGTSPYTIGLDGSIYEHFNPKYLSKSLNLKDLDESSISILLENEGWLSKNFEKNELITWSGDIYNRIDKPVDVKWRGKLRWAPYTQKQLDSLVLLCKQLSENFGIKLKTISHNTKVDNIAEKDGIYYRSNYTINYLDVSPAFNFNEFKNKIEEK